MKKAIKKSDKKSSVPQKKKSVQSPILAKDKAKKSVEAVQDELKTESKNEKGNKKKSKVNTTLKPKTERKVKAKELIDLAQTDEASEPKEAIPDQVSTEVAPLAMDFFDDESVTVSADSLINQIEAVIFSSSVPLSLDKIMQSLEDTKPALGEVRECLETLQQHYQSRGVHLVEVASGWRFQISQSCAPTIVKTLVEKPSRLSRALLETLALIAYRQPITRAEIEAIRGVVVSTHMIKTLLDHEWVRVVGHKDVPGKPALYATTKTFLDDMGLKKLDELPPLSEIKAMIPQEAQAASSPQSLEEISDLMAQASLVEETSEENNDAVIEENIGMETLDRVEADAAGTALVEEVDLNLDTIPTDEIEEVVPYDEE